MEGWFCTRCWQILSAYEVEYPNGKHRRCGGRALPVETARARLEKLFQGLPEEESQEPAHIVPFKPWV